MTELSKYIEFRIDVKVTKNYKSRHTIAQFEKCKDETFYDREIHNVVNPTYRICPRMDHIKNILYLRNSRA